MKLRRSPGPAADHETGIIPLVNIVFLLLVFFMLLGRISPLERFSVEPPVGAAGDTADLSDTVILVSAEGRIAIGDLEIAEDLLEATMLQLLERQPSTLVKIKADSGVDTTTVIRITEILRDAGVQRVLLLTVLEN